MSDIAIRVENLGKCYRIGAHQKQVKDWRGFLRNLIVSPFEYLYGTLRGPTEEETLWALEDVSFEVKYGEVVGIIGRNGAGKSTLLKILSRITEPTKGRARVYGRVGSLLEVGTGFHPELTGRENVYMNGAILGMNRAEIRRKFDEIVDFAGVEKFIDTPVKRYSSGMHVRLGFAVAAHLEPEVLLVDEVLAVGDAEFQKKCLGKMSDVAKGGRTVLFVSHNMAAVQNLCQRGLVVKNGQIAFNGDTSEAVAKYLGGDSLQSYGFVNLQQYSGRPPSIEQPIIQSLGLLSNNGVARYRNNFQTGEDVVFEIGYDCGDMSLNFAALAISSSMGERVCTVRTDLSPQFAGVLRGQGVLECRLSHLPLAAGEYNVMVAMGTKTPPRLVDWVEDALRFRVDDGNYFGTGNTLIRGQGYLAQPSHWSIAP